VVKRIIIILFLLTQPVKAECKYYAEVLIKRICKAEADTLDFYDYKKTAKKFREKELNENY